jgi:16S rRNA (cytosine1402-N4)-methyltransferase
MSISLSTENQCNEAGSLLLEPCIDEEDESFMEEYLHHPVMSREVLSLLDLRAGMTVVDGTVGLGGHALGLLEKILPGGRLIGLDKDAEALENARKNLKAFAKSCFLVHEDFRHLERVLKERGISRVDAVLFDLGVSSYQLDDPGRGFSIKNDGPLDMRMDRKGFISAYDLLNNLTEEEISSILWKFGQERFSRRIAHNIVAARSRSPISSTKQLAQLVADAVPYKMRFYRIHPATRTFQALRIAVNRELDALEEGAKNAAGVLKKGGRLCVISFHSLEDKIVKENFRALVKTGNYRLVFKKILQPSQEEILSNPRSRSAKMRLIERVK